MVTKQIVRMYYSDRPNRGKVKVDAVVVLPRSKQLSCKHVYRERVWGEQVANWRSVCKLCGITCRGRRKLTEPVAPLPK